MLSRIIVRSIIAIVSLGVAVDIKEKFSSK
jgi:hypothetical protein